MKLQRGGLRWRWRTKSGPVEAKETKVWSRVGGLSHNGPGGG